MAISDPCTVPVSPLSSQWKQFDSLLKQPCSYTGGQPRAWNRWQIIHIHAYGQFRVFSVSNMRFLECRKKLHGILVQGEHSNGTQKGCVWNPERHHSDADSKIPLNWKYNILVPQWGVTLDCRNTKQIVLSIKNRQLLPHLAACRATKGFQQTGTIH